MFGLCLMHRTNLSSHLCQSNIHFWTHVSEFCCHVWLWLQLHSVFLSTSQGPAVWSFLFISLHKVLCCLLGFLFCFVLFFNLFPLSHFTKPMFCCDPWDSRSFSVSVCQSLASWWHKPGYSAGKACATSCHVFLW